MMYSLRSLYLVEVDTQGSDYSGVGIQPLTLEQHRKEFNSTSSLLLCR